MTHNECRSNVCFLCLKKGKVAGKFDGLSASRVDFITHGILPDYENVKNFLPSGICSGCNNRVSRFMAKKERTPDNFEHAQSLEKYNEIIAELQTLSVDGIDPESTECVCVICCIARESNKFSTKGVKRPLPDIESDITVESSSENQADMCQICFSIGPHSSCTKKIRQKNLMQILSPASKQKLAAAIIKETKASEPSSSGEVILKTGGKPLRVSTEALKPAKETHSLFTGFQTDAGTSNKSSLKFAERYRAIHGRNSIESGLKSALVESGEICKDFFQWQNFNFEERDSLTGEMTEVSKPFIFCSDTMSFIDFVKNQRNIESDFVTHIGIDGGGGSIKVTLNLVPSSNPNVPQLPSASKTTNPLVTPPNHGPMLGFGTFSTPSESTPSPVDSDPDFLVSEKRAPSLPATGTTVKIGQSKNPRYLSSGVKKTLLLAVAPNVSESYANIKQILDSLHLFDGVDSLDLGTELSLHTDLSDWNKILGLQSHASTHPCSWCESPKDKWDRNAPLRTLGRIRQKAREYQAACREYQERKANGRLHKTLRKPQCADFLNCLNEPLISGSDDKSIFDVVPLPELHLMTGVVNHIFNELNTRWGENRAYEWAKQYSILNDSHHGDGFKGPSARRILRVASQLAVDTSLPRHLTVFAHALVNFNSVVSGCFGTEEHPSFNWAADIHAFEKSFLKLDISITPKVHAVIHHLPQWLELGKGPLGHHSEQATEACHYDFQHVLKNYAFNPLKLEQMAMQYLRAVLKYNSLHLNDPNM